jgi:hypothetical protein
MASRCFLLCASGCASVVCQCEESSSALLCLLLCYVRLVFAKLLPTKLVKGQIQVDSQKLVKNTFNWPNQR